MIDPFVRGPFPAGVRTLQAHDAARNRTFPCEVWYPAPAGAKETGNQNAVRDAEAEPGAHPLIVYSHPSLQHRCAATFLCTHLASHGYVVAAVDHSEVVAPELARRERESDQERAARWDALIASRVPDVRFLIDFLLATKDFAIDATRIGIVGHSFGAWTALEAAGADTRIRAVVALAAGGTSNPKPGILPLKLTFRWDVPTMYLVAENDACLPLSGMHETFDRTTAPKLMVVLRRADHMHFVDNVEEFHESFRTMPAPEPLASIQREMLPMAELCSGEQAHLFTRGLTLAHMDAILRENNDARRFLDGDVAGELASRGVDTIVRRA
jgi:dienelactone hydrolase